MIIHCNQSFSRISLTSISTKNMQMIYWENYYEVEWYKKLCTPIPAFSVFFNLIIHYISNLVKSYIWQSTLCRDWWSSRNLVSLSREHFASSVVLISYSVISCSIFLIIWCYRLHHKSVLNIFFWYQSVASILGYIIYY